MKTYFKVTISFLWLSLVCCSSSDDQPTVYEGECDFPSVISPSLYNNATTHSFSFEAAYVEGNCLFVQIGASGCDTSQWKVNLYDSGAVLESFPPQRRLRLVFDNRELCDAYFLKTYSFDITQLQVDGTVVMLGIEELAEQLEYSY